MSGYQDSNVILVSIVYQKVTRRLKTRSPYSSHASERIHYDEVKAIFSKNETRSEKYSE